MSDAVLVVQSECRVSFRDKFVAIQQEMSWNEVILRDASYDLVPIGLYGRTTPQQRAAMRYEPVRIDHVATADGVEYFEGHDFVLTHGNVNEPRKVQWLTGKGPSDGARYVIHYTCHPVWVVEETTYAIQHAQSPDTGILGKVRVQAFPMAFKVRLDYLTDQIGT